MRPEIVSSWLRCRDSFRIAVDRSEALPAETDPAMAPEESVVAAELGAAAMRLLPDVIALGAVVVVADGRGRMLSAWGDERAALRGAEQKLAPLYSWAEPSVGTTGVATALLASTPVAVRKHEHWCASFHDWSCTAVAVRDPFGRPAGVIGISLWRRDLPESVSQRLGSIAQEVETRLVPRLQGSRSLPVVRPATTDGTLVPTRLIGVRGARSLIVPVAAVRFAFVDDATVWLETDEGRIRSPSRGLDQLERQLTHAGFFRVSRTALVNVERVRELVPAFKGAVWVIMDGSAAPIAVSRRRVAALRIALGI